MVAGASSPPQPDRFSWGHAVDLVRMDATDAEQVRQATAGVDAVCYLVHGLSRRGFQERDRVAAEHVRDAVDEHGIGRVVYLSGLVPDVPEERLSPHIASRLEVERILRQSTAATLSLRAGVVIGAGSTSFEIIRQTASTLLVQPVPLWMHSRVQPIAIADVLRALADALEDDAVGDADIGGPDVVTYPSLLAMYAEAAHLPRVQVPVLAAPVMAVSLGAGLVSAAPYWTAAALVRSLQHDMICRPGQPDPDLVDLVDALPLEEALRQAVLADGAAAVPRDASPAIPPGCAPPGSSGPSSPPACPAAPCSARPPRRRPPPPRLPLPARPTRVIVPVDPGQSSRRAGS